MNDQLKLDMEEDTLTLRVEEYLKKKKKLDLRIKFIEDLKIRQAEAYDEEALEMFIADEDDPRKIAKLTRQFNKERKHFYSDGMVAYDKVASHA